MARSDEPAVSREASPTPPDEAAHALTPAAARPAVPRQRTFGFPEASAPARVASQRLASPAFASNDAVLRPAGPVRPLWVAVHLPVLPLDALVAGEVGGAVSAPHRAVYRAVYQAVYEEQQGLHRILLASRAAAGRGISPGLPVNAALALLPDLELRFREPAREARALEGLAAWAGCFTPRVSVERPDVLLLEIAGSLGLFGGLERLRRRLADGLDARDFTASLAAAPTPQAAVWLARAGTGASVIAREHLAGALGPLPLRDLGWPDDVLESLAGMGVARVSDCLRLPRQGFVRRFGARPLLQLDRALGRLPDPRANVRTPERFCRDCELAEEETDRDVLLAVCRGLLEALERFLVQRQVAVQRLRFDFFPLAGQAVPLTLGCLEPGCAAAHWLALLEMKLERLRLPAPVIAIRLRSGRPQALQAAIGDLPFDRTAARTAKTSVVRLLERLTARLGDEGVHGVTAVADHRPQYAWRTVRVAGGRLPRETPFDPWHARRAPQPLADRTECTLQGRLRLRRPLWMLAEPLPLAVERDVPQYGGPLRLEDGPERLETGWWDGNGIARDYFVAVNPGGLELWIYSPLPGARVAGANWYLHGLFA